VNAQKTAVHRVSWRKALLAFAALMAASVALAAWYKVHYSMGVAPTLEVAGAASAPKVLIATQSSAYKNAVTSGLVEHLKSRSATTRVIDITALPGVDDADWNAVVLIHTWEVLRPPTEVATFINRMRNRNHLVVLTTSGAGDLKMEGIDVITSASKMTDIPEQVRQLARRVDAILDSKTVGPAPAP
jgi:hypothetical protein